MGSVLLEGQPEARSRMSERMVEVMWFTKLSSIIHCILEWLLRLSITLQYTLLDNQFTILNDYSSVKGATQIPVKQTKKTNKQTNIIWAASWQNQQNGMCAQPRLRSARASAQYNQSLHCPYKKEWVFSHPLSAHRKLWCPSWSESSLGAQSFCWFCREAAHLQKGK